MQYKQCSPTLVPPTIFYHSRRNPHSSRKIPIRLFVMPYRYFLLMTNIERSPDGMTRFGTIIRNNAQLMLHTHLKIVTGKIYRRKIYYLTWVSLQMLQFYQIYIETDRCIQKKEKLTPKENSISFLSYKILLYYSSVQRSIV